ncbi:MAG: UDP-N-acetylglucosamine 4,6-dehydratase (inverting) [Acidaminococcales bacterium]|jgi:UDP-N-acetylglucosamine 4,6-dehydratase|nr:UDP-N-acetylglucosamine 4,6-dehydratase (inverting) [Acidaminococcales bacterium]
MFNGKAVMVTGGTGSFGRMFIKMLLARYKPRRVIVFSRDELKQFDMRQTFDHPCMRYFLGDVRDEHRLLQAMLNVDYVAHAAALKQVPAAEYNPMECIKTNVMGAQNVINAALECKVEKVIALSTDKAANPINLYGATKLASDKLFVAANNLAGNRPTVFSVVRYGNVVGSRGSVAPFFRELAARGAKELPVTHPGMTRFWLRLEDGVDFVLASFKRMRGGEIFVPKIPSMRILDLAKAVAPHLPVKITGIRPGEKLHEVMCPADSYYITVEFDKYYVIKPTIDFAREVDYERSLDGESGRPVPENFEYSSGVNPHFLTVEELREMNGP